MRESVPTSSVVVERVVTNDQNRSQSIVSKYKASVKEADGPSLLESEAINQRRERRGHRIERSQIA